MTIAALGWFIAVICVIIFVTLWFIVCFKELSVKRNSLDSITEQIHMHRRLHMQERGGENDAAAQNILEHKLMVYREVEKEYNALLKRPMKRIPSYIMGFHSKRKEKGI
ncbi:MAG: hypothetical protein K0S41_256 [Anaerocolumna sp.]|jgi:hypothetical protein|nr:hypothetical protein [Anaerocolumna sp.]